MNVYFDQNFDQMIERASEKTEQLALIAFALIVLVVFWPLIVGLAAFSAVYLGQRALKDRLIHRLNPQLVIHYKVDGRLKEASVSDYLGDLRSLNGVYWTENQKHTVTAPSWRTVLGI